MSTVHLDGVDDDIVRKFTAKARSTLRKIVWNLRELGGFAVLITILNR